MGISHYRDRRHAGKVLAGALCHLRDIPDVLVLALPRGGVPVAFEVALALGAPLLLRHVMTQQCLAAEAFTMGTDWGVEREVSVCTFAPAGHVASLQAAAASKPEASLLKSAVDANVWRFA